MLEKNCAEDKLKKQLKFSCPNKVQLCMVVFFPFLVDSYLQNIKKCQKITN